MLRNYYTLYHVARQLHQEIAGGYLFEIHSQERNELTLSFVAADGRHLQLIVTVRSQEFSLSAREGLNRKRRNSSAVMSRVYERQVTGVDMAPRDREIRVRLDGGWFIVLRFFSADTNVLLVHEGTIADSFKEFKRLEGLPYSDDPGETPVFRSLELLAGDEARFGEMLEATGDDAPLERRLASFLPGFDRSLARRLIARTGGDHSPQALFIALGGMMYELATPSPHVTEPHGKAPEFSILEPVEGEDSTPFDEVLEAMNHYARRMHHFLHLHAGAGELRRELKQQIDRTERELSGLQSADPVETAARYETCGHLLTAAIGTADPSSGEVTVPNLFEPGSPDLLISVRPEMNMQQNAAWYFSRATRSRAKAQATNDRRALLDSRLRELRLKLDALDIAESGEELGDLIAKNRKPKPKGAAQERKQDERQARFRTVPLTLGITLYIGKDARNNELLTFGHARPDDIWLHARGASGSHCVVKGAGMHNMSEIRRAAEIAAWYSAARTSGMVPVIYTLKKHVRKAKGAAGSVIVEREKVIMVKPRKE